MQSAPTAAAGDMLLDAATERALDIETAEMRHKTGSAASIDGMRGKRGKWLAAGCDDCTAG